MTNHPNRGKRLAKYTFGVYEHDGFKVLRTIRRATDAEAEAAVDDLYYESGYDMDGNKHPGVYIRRGNAKWYCRFSAHAGPGSSSPDYLAPLKKKYWIKELGEWLE